MQPAILPADRQRCRCGWTAAPHVKPRRASWSIRGRSPEHPGAQARGRERFRHVRKRTALRARRLHDGPSRRVGRAFHGPPAAMQRVGTSRPRAARLSDPRSPALENPFSSAGEPCRARRTSAAMLPRGRTLRRKMWHRASFPLTAGRSRRPGGRSPRPDTTACPCTPHCRRRSAEPRAAP